MSQTIAPVGQVTAPQSTLRQHAFDLVGRIRGAIGDLEDAVDKVHGNDDTKPAPPAIQGSAPANTPPVAISIEQAHNWMGDLEKEIARLIAKL